MTVHDAKKLRENDCVKWADGTLGTIRETNYAAIKIEWDDGQWALMPFADDKAPWHNLERGKR